jgi:hypothetical protein
MWDLGITDIPAGWKRELLEWLLAVAAISLGVVFPHHWADYFRLGDGAVWPVR